MRAYLPIFLSFFIFIPFVHASPSHSETGKKAAGKVATESPRCVQDPNEVQKIKDTIKANSKTEFKYNGYREAFQNEGDNEIMARLIYAETVAANCPKMNSDIAPLIAKVIANRAANRGDVKSVLFQRDQFASSMNIYEESRYADFLCPKDSKLWALSLSSATQSLLEKNKSDTVHYFLYQHSPKWNKAPWNFKEDTTGITPQIQKCVRFFHNPKWK